ncbi:GntR family transcriptional regulator [Kribbella sp. VKM Ac-2566]|nr:GntR family transcriptional regulator [Kribbella sp. VKM Ac-2566]
MPGDRLPPERELAQRLGVSRATLSQALVALEVIGAVVVRHGDGTVLTERARTAPVIEAIRAHADRLPEIIEARDALESKLAALAASRRTEADLTAIRSALDTMERDIEAGGRGVEGDEAFHGAVTAAARSGLLAQMMTAIHDLIRETRLESLSQPGRPRESLAGHRKVADAIAAGDPVAATQAMHEHVMLVSDVALLRDRT